MGGSAGVWLQFGLGFWVCGQAYLPDIGTFSSSLLRTDRQRALCSRSYMI